jgi:hypothetical protein
MHRNGNVSIEKPLLRVNQLEDKTIMREGSLYVRSTDEGQRK